MSYEKLALYFKLMRFNKPIGIYLLWFPTAWALWLANQGHPSSHLVGYFLLGTMLMRAAGCVINDIADRHIDGDVERTRDRPLATKALSLSSACILLGILFILAFMIVLQLPTACLFWALFAAFVTILYPFCKRYIQAPQLVLGVAFSMGIPMAYIASGVAFNNTMILLLCINYIWIVAYDTMYAMADRIDDLRIGVKSTAILFGQYDRRIILWMQALLHALWFLLPMQKSVAFYGLWFLAGIVLIKQQSQLKVGSPAACFNAFLLNAWYGLFMWIALIF